MRGFLFIFTVSLLILSEGYAYIITDNIPQDAVTKEYEFMNPVVLQGSYEIEYIDGLPFTKWTPPQWWSKRLTAIFLGCPAPDLDKRIIRCLCKYAVLDDSQANYRKNLPYDKIPDGSFFIFGDNSTKDFSKRISEISDYASGEILILKQPFTETVERII